jgi:hypothetical protein
VIIENLREKQLAIDQIFHINFSVDHHEQSFIETIVELCLTAGQLQ